MGVGMTNNEILTLEHRTEVVMEAWFDEAERVGATTWSRTSLQTLREEISKAILAAEVRGMEKAATIAEDNWTAEAIQAHDMGAYMARAIGNSIRKAAKELK